MYDGLNQNFLQHRRKLNVEAGTRCPLLCPGCSRTKHMLGLEPTKLEIGDLSLENFRLIVRPENNLEAIVYNMALGDPIYSATIMEQIEYMNTLEKRPKISCSTNGSGRSKDWWIKFSSLLHPTKDRIEFAIDGLEDTNHIYRVNAKWDSVITGVRTLRENFSGPIMWRYIVFEHNYHQVPEARELATDLGVTFFQAILGDSRTPEHMKLKSKPWSEIIENIS